MLLDREVRLHLVDVFNIRRSGVIEIRDQTVVTDGYTLEDLDAITQEAMARYIGSDMGSFMRMWDVTISRANFDMHPPIGAVGGEIQTLHGPMGDINVIVKDGKVVGMAEMTVEKTPTGTIEHIEEIIETPAGLVTIDETITINDEPHEAPKKRGRPAKIKK